MAAASGALAATGRAAAFAAAGWLALTVEFAPKAGSGGPDLLFCVAAFWAIRRPRSAPAALIVALGLARDLLDGGPVGAGALGLLAATEALRALGPRLRRGSLLSEAGHVAAAAALAAAIPWLMLGLTLADAPPFGDVARRVGLTALAWPATVLALRGVLRLRSEASPADGDPMFGRRA